MKSDKRKSNRVVLSLPVHYKVFQLEKLEKDVLDNVLGSRAAIQNVSSGGVQVVSSSPFHAGDVLELELEIPGGGRVRSVAKVVWCRKERQSAHDYRSGIQFIPVYQDDLGKLHDYLKRGG